MTKRLPKLALFCIAFTFAASGPIGATGQRDGASLEQNGWCPAQPQLVARQSLKDGVDLEPHHAAVLAACTEQAAWEAPSAARSAVDVAATSDF
jgi:hypothetical protein